MTRVKSELEMQAAMIGKLRNKLNNAQHLQALFAEQIRRLEIDKIALEMDKDVLEKERGICNNNW